MYFWLLGFSIILVKRWCQHATDIGPDKHTDHRSGIYANRHSEAVSWSFNVASRYERELPFVAVLKVDW